MGEENVRYEHIAETQILKESTVYTDFPTHFFALYAMLYKAKAEKASWLKPARLGEPTRKQGWQKGAMSGKNWVYRSLGRIEALQGKTDHPGDSSAYFEHVIPHIRMQQEVINNADPDNMFEAILYLMLLPAAEITKYENTLISNVKSHPNPSLPFIRYKNTGLRIFNRNGQEINFNTYTLDDHYDYIETLPHLKPFFEVVENANTLEDVSNNMIKQGFKIPKGATPPELDTTNPMYKTLNRKKLKKGQDDQGIQ